jgi:hypothetical protein
VPISPSTKAPAAIKTSEAQICQHARTPGDSTRQENIDVSRLFRQFALAAIMAVAAAAPAHAADFLKAIEDMPLPHGMSEQPEPVVFESDQGRVVRTSIHGNTPCKEVESFYASTLPALGWVRQPDAAGGLWRFKRESEQLSVSSLCITADAHGLFTTQISFELVVKLASTRLAE